MDPEKLKSLADAEFDRAVHRKNIKESAYALLLVPYNGGLFIATPTLIAFLGNWDEDEIIVEDEYENPVLVNRLALMARLKGAYLNAMDVWYADFQASNRIRRAANV